jgi:8-oxo-dGTP pyrophosphatase MutT (NUDIX family)
MTEQYCNNCGKQGHLYHQCKLPITSNGIIAFRINDNKVEYLMICRKDSLGYIDMIRGKYNINDEYYMLSMIDQMSIKEKINILRNDFDTLWNNLWGHNNVKKYKNEYEISKNKFETLKSGVVINAETVSFATIIKKSKTKWTTPEWGFPKGRRNFQENDYNCAIREFCEETGYNSSYLRNIENIFPMEEIFTGSNHKSYKHKYFLSYIEYEISNNEFKHQKSEVSDVKWLCYDEAINLIRDYNLEKKKILANIDNILKTYRLFQL